MSVSRQPINLVLLPGLLNDARLWQHQIDTLASIANVSVADLTRKGTIAALAADVLAQAPVGTFALAGLSMGGYVALEIMRQAPERIVALALLDTSARPDTPEATEGRHKAIEAAGRNFPEVTENLLPKLLHPAHLNDAAIVDPVKAMADRIGKAAFVRQQYAIMARIDSRPSLKQIQCPTLILCGREDKITPVELHEEMTALIPSTTLTIVEHSGHLSALEQPAAVSEALRNWLQGI